MKRIEEIIELIEITGDKCIILHQQTDAYVLMKFEEYKNFYKNRLNSAEKSDNAVNYFSSPNPIFNRPKEQSLRSIPQKPADVREFELRKPVIKDKDQDVYYTEPLIE